MNEEHICKATVLHCIDFRIQRFLNEYLEERFAGSYDRISVAGGVRNVPLDQFEVSIRLHQPKTIVLIQHEDCGAYGGSKEFDGLEVEKAFQDQELQKAEQALKNTFPRVVVAKFFILLSGDFQSF